MGPSVEDQSADNAGRNCARQTIRVADRNDIVSDFDIPATCNFQVFEISGVNFDKRKLAIGPYPLSMHQEIRNYANNLRDKV